MTTSEVLLLSTAWILFFTLHSVFASLKFKGIVDDYLPNLSPAYRVMFNVTSSLLILIPIFLEYHLSGDLLWQWNGGYAIIANGLAIVAILCFIWTLKYYDGSDFSGLKQLRQRITAVTNEQGFVISPLHRFVRHPWYFLLLIIIWTRSMDQASLISALLITAYLIVGSVLEENKLLVFHGAQYKSYKNQVPGLVPLPWKYLRNSSKP